MSLNLIRSTKIKKLLISLSAIFLIAFSAIGWSQVIDKAPLKEQTKEDVYWLKTNSDVGHDKKYRWYGKTKEGRYIKKEDDRSCKVCGG